MRSTAFIMLLITATLFLVIPSNLYSQNIDITLLKYINLNRNKALDELFKAFSNYTAIIAYGLPLILLGYSFFKKNTKTRKKAYYIGISVIISGIISTIIKHSINRPRPFITYTFIEKVSSGGSPSFPSGHTTDAFAFATAVSIAYPKWYVIISSYTWAGIIGYSRMNLGVHYPSDVLAGIFLGSSTAFILYKFQKWINKKQLNSN